MKRIISLAAMVILAATMLGSAASATPLWSNDLKYGSSELRGWDASSLGTIADPYPGLPI